MHGQEKTDRQLDERLNFLGLGHGERQNLSDMKGVITGSLDASLDRFYAKVRSVSETAKFFANDAHVQHAKAMQLKHWARIASGTFNADYTDAVTAIGRTHARLGLEPRWYIGGYALMLDGIVKALIESELKGLFMEKKARKVKDALSATIKAALLDMDYSISVYLDVLAAERHKVEAEQAQMKKEQEHVLALLNSALDRLANGDLTSSIGEKTAPQFQGLIANFNAAVGNLSGAFAQIVEEANKISGNTRELTSATDDMARRTEQQAAALEETAAAVEEITTISKLSAQRSEEAKAIVESSAVEAARSRDVVTEAVKAMGAIEDSSQKITQIISVIDEISFQTNLLALNAGVEAARAGEAGKGFAVVAQEVRELAQRSATAAKEIKSLINASGTQVENGVGLVTRAGSALQEIAEQVRDINTNVVAIVDAAREQSTALAEINQAVNTVDQGTQQNAAMVEEQTAASHSLAREATALFELLGQFRFDDATRYTASPRGGFEQQPVPASPRRGASRPLAARGSAAVAVNHEEWQDF